jgi:putative transcriptional regulator
VSPRSAWVLYRGEKKWEHDAELTVTDNWRASGDRSIVEAIARGEGPEPFRLLLGYAGWGPGQLSTEIGDGMWMPVEANEEVGFADTVGEDLWLRAYEVCVGVSPYAFISHDKGMA